MQLARKRASTPWRVGSYEAVLNDIERSDVHTTVWERELGEDVARYARRVAESDFGLRLDGVSVPDLRGACIIERLPPGPGVEGFAADVATCIHRYARAAETWKFRAELKVITTDKCRRFHVDYYRLRWVCTYAGPGTEWLSEDDVVAEMLDHGPKEAEAFNRCIARGADRVRRLTPGDVLLMKGRGHEGERAGLGGPVHRSPPVVAIGARRLVLTMTC